MSKPIIIKSETVYKGFFDLQVDTLLLPGKEPMHYTSLIVSKEVAVILALTPEGQFLINREYRHPTGKHVLGLPGGRVDPGEIPYETAKRELEEETGYSAKEFILLGITYPFPAVCDQKIHYYLAKDAIIQSSPQKEPYELIETLQLSLDEIFTKIQEGEAVDGILFPALAFYRQSK